MQVRLIQGAGGRVIGMVGCCRMLYSAALHLTEQSPINSNQHVCKNLHVSLLPLHLLQWSSFPSTMSSWMPRTMRPPATSSGACLCWVP